MSSPSARSHQRRRPDHHPQRRLVAGDQADPRHSQRMTQTPHLQETPSTPVIVMDGPDPERIFMFTDFGVRNPMGPPFNALMTMSRWTTSRSSFPWCYSARSPDTPISTVRGKNGGPEHHRRRSRRGLESVSSRESTPTSTCRMTGQPIPP